MCRVEIPLQLFAALTAPVATNRIIDLAKLKILFIILKCYETGLSCHNERVVW